MTMARFNVAPREGHLTRVQHVYGYLYKIREAMICIRTEEPDYSGIPKKEFDWFYTCYAGAYEEIPDDIPEPKSRPLQPLPTSMQICIMISSVVDLLLATYIC